MNITIEAIYEAGVLRPLQPLPDLRENEKVRVTVETEGIVERQARNRLIVDAEALRELMEDEGCESAVDLLLRNPIKIDPVVAREIIESADFSVLEN